MIKIQRLYDADGKWIGPKDKMLSIGGEKIHIDDYAKQHGITLPKGKKPINTDIEEKHADMEQSLDSGHTEVDGDGDSESSE